MKIIKTVALSTLIAIAVTLLGCSSSKTTKVDKDAPKNLKVFEQQLITIQKTTQGQLRQITSSLEKQIKTLNSQIPVMYNKIQKELQDQNKLIQLQMKQIESSLQKEVQEVQNNLDKAMKAKSRDNQK